MKWPELESVEGTFNCQFSVIENKLAKLYRNQEKIYKLLQDVHNTLTNEEDSK